MILRWYFDGNHSTTISRYQSNMMTSVLVYIHRRTATAHLGRAFNPPPLWQNSVWTCSRGPLGLPLRIDSHWHIEGTLRKWVDCSVLTLCWNMEVCIHTFSFQPIIHRIQHTSLHLARSPCGANNKGNFNLWYAWLCHNLLTACRSSEWQIKPAIQVIKLLANPLFFWYMHYAASQPTRSGGPRFIWPVSPGFRRFVRQTL